MSKAEEKQTAISVSHPKAFVRERRAGVIAFNLLMGNRGSEGLNNWSLVTWVESRGGGGEDSTLNPTVLTIVLPVWSNKLNQVTASLKKT